jgi:hypothetical protein
VREPGPLPRHFLLQILQCVANAPGNYTEVPKFYAAPDHQARPPVEFSGTTASRAALATGLVGSEVEGISASWFFHRWLLHDASDAARDTMTQIADKTVSVADRALHRLRDTIPDRDDRDTYLLGAAALAVAAAVGIAYHRRAQEDTRLRGH